MRRRTLQPLVDELAAAIAAGRWRAGDQLPPQRTLAAERGLAASTVSLAYRALVESGLAVGETGRGTFVRGRAETTTIAAEPSGTWVDLALNVPMPDGLSGVLAPALAALAARPARLAQALRPVAVTGTSEARGVLADFVSTPGWRVDPSQVLFTATGKQAIAAAVTALVPRGGRLGCDPLTYPVLKSIAAAGGIDLVPLAMDAAGTVPASLVAAHARRKLHAVYLQPVLHNPLGVTMPGERRRALAAALKRLELTAVEDVVYAFLVPDAARLAREAPERVVVVDSFGKRIAPGLSVGIVVAPPALVAPIVTAARRAAHGPGGLALEVCTRWVAGGQAEVVTAAKRRDAAQRQRILRHTLCGLSVQSDPRAYHAWLTLPEGWRAERFEAAAAAAGIAVVRAAAYAARPGHAPNAVRLALASPTPSLLRAALQTLAGLARRGPDERQPR